MICILKVGVGLYIRCLIMCILLDSFQIHIQRNYLVHCNYPSLQVNRNVVQDHVMRWPSIAVVLGVVDDLK